MRYTDIIFDFDGTLLDTSSGIEYSLDAALAEHGFTGDYDRSIIIGPPLMQVIGTAAGFTGEKCEQAVETYRRIYREKGQFMAQPYPGVVAMLQALTQRGAHCYVATSKLESAARTMAEHFGLMPYLRDISGATPDFSRGDKTSVLTHLLATNDIAKPRAVMIGDRAFDLIGARDVGIDAIGVAYGFAPSPSELSAEKPVAVAQTVSELSRLLLEGV